MDGIDAALVRISGPATQPRVRLLGFEMNPYSAPVRRTILRIAAGEAATAGEISQLNFLLGELFAEATLRVCRTARVPPARLAAIGSHGQTIYHQGSPTREAGRLVTSTLQVAEPAVIAERTGAPVVADFRPADMAAGGQGAPLVPLVDYLLFSSDTSARVVLNIGGISNVTYLPAGGGMADVLAYDTGPGNMVIDELVQLMTKGAQPYDEDGAIAAAGTVNDVLLEVLLKHEFLQRPPPKSTGREEFGRAYALKIRNWRGRRRGKLPPRDTVATATRFTAVSIAGSLRKFILPKGPLDELIVSGGGALNPVLMRQLACELPGVRVSKSDCYGIPVKSKECIAFAILARETILGRPGNLPSATGAAGPRILGQFTPV